jgi:hypothetical protein
MRTGLEAARRFGFCDYPANIAYELPFAWPQWIESFGTLSGNHDFW